MTAPTTVTVLATDLVGSTAQRVELGEEAADNLRRRHDARLVNIVGDHDGRVVKGLGDGVLACFPSASAAISAAVDIQQRLDEFDIRIGISAGDVTFEDDDVFGTTVIEAIRLCGRAVGGEVLVADLVGQLNRGRGGLELTPVGDLALKGLTGPVATSRVEWKHTTDDRPRFPAHLDSVTAFGFAGRDAALAYLAESWADASRGAGRAMIVTGEPGIGKTRTVAKFARTAHARGATVVYGHCDDQLSAPFRPFTVALRTLIDALPDAVLHEHVSEFGGVLARLLPALPRRVGPIESLDGSPEELRPIVFDAVAGVLQLSSQLSPVLLVVDDLHWADEPTLLLFRHLAKVGDLGAVMVVGCCRDTEGDEDGPLSSLLGDLRRVERARRLDLEGLDADEILQLMLVSMPGRTRRSASTADIQLAKSIHQSTAGNPFFVTEILSHLAETDGSADGNRGSRAPFDLSVPVGIREVVAQRLHTLTDTVKEILVAAAVMGDEFDLRVLAHVVDRDDVGVVAALEDAMERKLVIEVSDATERFRFRHALVRQAVYESLSSSRRVRLHARIGSACAELGRGSMSLRAHHLLEASELVGTRAITDATTLAVREAMHSQAWETAVRWAQRGLDAIHGLDDGSPDAESRLLVECAVAQMDGGDLRRARETLASAVPGARTARDGSLLARIASHYAAAGMGYLDHDDALGLELVADASTMLPPGDSPERARLLLAEAQLRSMSPEPDLVISPARQGLEMTRRTDPDRLGDALFVYCEALRGGGDVESLREAAAEARTLSNPIRRASFLHFEILARMSVGRFRDVERLAQECIDAGKRLRSRLFSWCGHSAFAGLHTFYGRWDDALVEIETMKTLGEVLGDTGIGIALYAEQFLARRRRDFEGMRRANDEMIERVPQFALTPRDTVIGALDGSMGHEELAGAAAEWYTLVPLLPYWVKRGSLAWMTPVMRHAPPDVAAAADEIVAPSGDLWLSAGVHETQGHCAWVRGALAEAEGDLDSAIDLYERAHEIHAKAGELPIRANNLVWVVEALHKRAGGSDAERARSLAEESALIGERLGITGLADHVMGIAN